MTSSARPPRRSASPWLLGALVAGAAAWARHRGPAPWPQDQRSAPVRVHPPAPRIAELLAVPAEPDRLQCEIEHLVKVRLPAVLAGRPDPAADRPDDLPSGTTALLDQLLGQVSGAMLERDESRRMALVELASRVQTSAHRIQQAMSGLAERHPGDPDLLETTMRVDHAATQQARHAQSLKVLCDEWPGQQWPGPLALVDVVRAASGRIVAFSRVQVSGDQTVAAVPSVVEPLIHLVAELLANATEYSPPSSPVTVSVRGVQRGAVIELDDSGFGLDEYRLAEAREIVSGRRPMGVGDVGEIPQTGFAVVGRFARRHGFTVDLGMSPYGGVRAVVLVPSSLVVTVALPVPRPEPVVPEPPEPAQTSTSNDLFVPNTPVTVTDPPVDGSEIRLPQRRSRRRDQSRPFGGAPRPVVAAAPDVEPDEAGDWMERFFEGSQPIPITPQDNDNGSTTRKDEAQG